MEIYSINFYLIKLMITDIPNIFYLQIKKFKKQYVKYIKVPYN